MRNPFGQTARDARVNARKSLRDVADALDFSAVYISDIERGRRNPPSPEVARTWALAIGADPDEFERLAFLGRREVTLDVEEDDGSTLRNQAAFALARRWTNLSDEQYRQIKDIVESTEG